MCRVSFQTAAELATHRHTAEHKAVVLSEMQAQAGYGCLCLVPQWYSIVTTLQQQCNNNVTII
eukprot:1190005-Prorocentrum_minimum.AAC.13